MNANELWLSLRIDHLEKRIDEEALALAQSQVYKFEELITKGVLEADGAVVAQALRERDTAMEKIHELTQKLKQPKLKPLPDSPTIEESEPPVTEQTLKELLVLILQELRTLQCPCR